MVAGGGVPCCGDVVLLGGFSFDASSLSVGAVGPDAPPCSAKDCLFEDGAEILADEPPPAEPCREWGPSLGLDRIGIESAKVDAAGEGREDSSLWVDGGRAGNSFGAAVSGGG